MDPVALDAGLSGGQLLSGGGGLAALAGLIAWIVKDNAKKAKADSAADAAREKSRNETSNAILTRKDETIAAMHAETVLALNTQYAEVMGLLKGDVETMKTDNKNMERRLARLEGNKVDA